MTKQSDILNLSKLVIEFLEGTISPEEFSQLDRMIVEEDNAVDVFFDFIAIHTILSQQEGEYQVSGIEAESLFAEIGKNYTLGCPIFKRHKKNLLLKTSTSLYNYLANGQ